MVGRYHITSSRHDLGHLLLPVVMKKLVSLVDDGVTWERGQLNQYRAVS